MILKEFYNLIFFAFAAHYPASEATVSARIVAEECFGITRRDMIVEPDREVGTEGLESVLADIAAMRPVQYIVGRTEFCGINVNVSEGVLIPRPETEELVYRIVSDYKDSGGLRILDIGTGSGAIAAALQALLPESDVTGWDISDDALRIAASNGVTVEKHDILVESRVITPDKFDIIVSNPPYICVSEQSLMRQNVLAHEPHLALFVPDNDPLIFYREIARFASLNLTIGGRLYFEINEAYGNACADLLIAMGYAEVEVLQDIHGKDRMLCGRKTR